jgi:hypothetical protein
LRRISVRKSKGVFGIKRKAEPTLLVTAEQAAKKGFTVQITDQMLNDWGKAAPEAPLRDCLLVDWLADGSGRIDLASFLSGLSADGKNTTPLETVASSS